MKIEILLRDDVEHVGRCGDRVKVAPGFARNFLFPRKLALEVTPGNLAAMQRRRARAEAEEEKRTAELDVRIAALSKIRVKTVERADESGQLFGSVHAATIARLLGEAGFPVEEGDVRLDEPIKVIGEHKVRVHVHADKHAEIALVVEAGAA